MSQSARTAQPTKNRQRTWRRPAQFDRTITVDGYSVQIADKWVMEVYHHTFTLTCEGWAGLPAASGWWLAVDGPHAGEGSRQRVSARMVAPKDAVRLDDVRQIVGFIKTAWAAGRESAVCAECHQERSASNTCSCTD